MTTRYALFAFSLLLAPAALAQTWMPQSSGVAADLGGVYFLDEATGFAVGDKGLLLSTADGGQTWNSQILGGGALDLEGIAFNTSGTVGLIATDDGPVYRSTDSGATWVIVATGAADLRHVSWVDDQNVWVAGRKSSAARSADGGQTWTALSTGSADRTESIAAVSATEAWIVNRSGGIRHTTDGGVSWSAQSSGTGNDLNDIQMLDATTGYIAGSGDIVLKTTNGGTTWTSVSNGTAGGNGLFFLDANTGWTVDDAGQIWFTADGGASWTLQPSGTSAALSRVHLPDSNHGWAVGGGGAVVAFTSETTAAEAGVPDAPVALSTPTPNPFVDQTTLTVEVGRLQRVRVEVFDVLGRQVALLHDGAVASGVPLRLSLEADGLPSGLYVIRAIGEAFSATRRATLMR